MRTKPLIGLNADFRDAHKHSPAMSVLHAGYYDSIIKGGGLPVILPPLEDNKELERNIDQYLNVLDGFVLVGGADLDPRNDGYALHPSVQRMSERRETFDRFLIDKIAERKMPLLAIGTGMQLLNVSQGGTLFLDIAEDLPRAMPHRDLHDYLHRHALIVEPKTFMASVYGEIEVRVNSEHHMAVDDVAAGLFVSARSPDGVIEAIESIRSDWFVVGTQFHPESHTATAMDSRLFELFLRRVSHRQIVETVLYEDEAEVVFT